MFGVEGALGFDDGGPDGEQRGEIGELAAGDFVEVAAFDEAMKRFGGVVVAAEFAQGAVHALDKSGVVGDGCEDAELGGVGADGFFEEGEAHEFGHGVGGGGGIFLAGGEEREAGEAEDLRAEGAAGFFEGGQEHAFGGEGKLFGDEEEQRWAEGLFELIGGDVAQECGGFSRSRSADEKADAQNRSLEKFHVKNAEGLLAGECSGRVWAVQSCPRRLSPNGGLSLSLTRILRLGYISLLGAQ